MSICFYENRYFSFCSDPHHFVLQAGMVFVWKIDSKGRPLAKPLCQENLPEPVQQIILQPPENPDSYT